MGFRRFIDRSGHAWDVQDQTDSQWRFQPVGGNPGPVLNVPAPGYEKDPFELSNDELQRMLDAAPRPRTPPRRSPFQD